MSKQPPLINAESKRPRGKPKTPVLSEAEKYTMRGLRKRGVTLEEIARVFNVSKSTVKRVTDHVPSGREEAKRATNEFGEVNWYVNEPLLQLEQCNEKL